MYNKKTLSEQFNRRRIFKNHLLPFQNILQKKRKLHIATYQPFPITQLLDSKPADNTIYLFDKKMYT